MEGARPATPDDLAVCARLLHDAEHAVSGRRGGVLLVADRSSDRPSASGGDALASWMADPGHVLVVGTLDDAVVGVAAGHVRHLPASVHAGGLAQDLGVVDCLYVEPDARGVGVGSALTAALVETFRRLGCSAVDAPALPGDRETKQRFEAAGFSARLLVLHRRLP